MKLIYQLFLIVFTLSLALGFYQCTGTGSDESQVENGDVESMAIDPIFTLLEPEETGIHFENTLTEGMNTNVLMYEYFYNGGGIAVGDFNGDEWMDIYFTSNMSDNKLYLNKGDLIFEDITEVSGAGGRSGPWKTGVTAVDINGDNLLDLYVSYSGALPPEKRVNQLFINQGNNREGIPTFVEQAEQFGLNSPAFSNQIYFFDYDRDEDLDAILLNHNPRSLPILNEAQTAEMMGQDDPMQGVRLFRQDNGRFLDVTAEVGVVGSGLSYGLGVGIADVNQDGWPDFYISNDYAVPDYLYINQQNGTFKNELSNQMGHNTHFSMGNDIADVNNDGWPDVVTLDMLPEDNQRQKLLLAPDNYSKFEHNLRSGFHYQYMMNMLQLNNGNNSFSEIGQLAGISNTDWSWSALLEDYDNDGWKDLYITNGYFRDYTNMDFINYMDNYVQTKGRLKREDVLEILKEMPASNVTNYMFRNEGNNQFANQVVAWGLNHTANSNGAAYADLDNDGDMELITNNINQPAFVYKNESVQQLDHHFIQIKLKGDGKNTHAIGAQVLLFANGQIQMKEHYLTRGYLSSVSPIIHFGLGQTTQVDSIVVHWPTGNRTLLQQVKVDQRIEIDMKDSDSSSHPKVHEPMPIFEVANSGIPFTHRENSIRDFNRQSLLISQLSHSGPDMATGDLNGDGYPDFVIGGSELQPTSVYLSEGSGNWSASQTTIFDEHAACHDTDIEIIDLDNDGDKDLYVASGGYHQMAPTDKNLIDRMYLNDGTGKFEISRGLPEITSSTAVAAFGDLNGDSHPDLFIGSRVIPGRYPEAPESYLLVNDGQGGYTDVTAEIAPEFRTIGMVTDAEWVDLNGDDRPELIIVGEWMPIHIYSFQEDKLVNVTDQYLPEELSGWWNTLKIADLNADGMPDLIVGNMGLNTQFKVSTSQPAEIFYSDFDDNGYVDPIFTYYIQGQRYPYLTRDELLKQLTSLRKRYPTYESYADATIEDVLNSETLNKAQEWSANYMETVLLLSTPSRTFELGQLPIQSQYAPVYAIHVFDYDDDQKLDLLLCGNNEHAKLRLGKFDANYGVLLQGTGNGKFRYVNQRTSGFDLRGEVRSIIELNDRLYFGIYGRPIECYEWNTDLENNNSAL